MDVRMVGHCRAPAVEHGGGADASAEVPGIVGLQPTSAAERHCSIADMTWS